MMYVLENTLPRLWHQSVKKVWNKIKKVFYYF